MKNIALSIPDFRGGGAEKVMVTLANFFNRESHNVTMIVRSTNGPRVNELDCGVNIIVLKSKSIISQAIEIKKLCDVNKIDILIGTLAMAYISAISNIFGNKSRVVSRLGNTISQDLKRFKGAKKVLVKLYQNVLVFSDEVVFQSTYMKNDFFMTLLMKKIRNYKVIYNPIDSSMINMKKTIKSHIDISKKDIVCVGRLEYQKNYALTLEVFYHYCKNNSDGNLHILGDGYEYEKLKTKVDSFGLNERVFFHGYQENPYNIMARAGVFLLTSRFEGFSNAILEAQFLGLPTVVTDVPGGNREIVKHGVNGFLFDQGNSKFGAQCLNKAFNIVSVLDLAKYDIINISSQYHE